MKITSTKSGSYSIKLSAKQVLDLRDVIAEYMVTLEHTGLLASVHSYNEKLVATLANDFYKRNIVKLSLYEECSITLKKPEALAICFICQSTVLNNPAYPSLQVLTIQLHKRLSQ